jgi:formyltetrahydrofolate synthetase
MTNKLPSDTERAQAEKLRPIRDVASELGLTDDELIGFGTTKQSTRGRRLEGDQTR